MYKIILSFVIFLFLYCVFYLNNNENNYNNVYFEYYEEEKLDTIKVSYYIDDELVFDDLKKENMDEIYQRINYLTSWKNRAEPKMVSYLDTDISLISYYLDDKQIILNFDKEISSSNFKKAKRQIEETFIKMGYEKIKILVNGKSI